MSMDDAHNEAIGPQVMSLMALFRGPLKSVKFPDVDAQLLESDAAGVLEEAAAVERAEAALLAAQKTLAERQEALLQRALRAFAYARIFAEGDEALAAQLEATGLSRAVRRSGRMDGQGDAGGDGGPRRRGRPPKNRTNAPLFVEPLEEAELPGEKVSASSH